MPLSSASLITLINTFARGAHLLLFLAIGNIFGATEITDTVLLMQAPLLTVMAIAAGVTEVIVMPAMHRAENLGCTTTLRKLLLQRGLISIIPITAGAIIISIIITTNATWALALILFPMPLLATLSATHIGTLNARGKHKVSVLGPLYGALLSLPLIFILPQTAIGLALLLLSYELARASGLWLHVRITYANDTGNQAIPENLLSELWRNAKFQAVGSLTLALNPLIDDLFAIGLGGSAITLVEYSSRLWNVIPLMLSGHLLIAYASMSHTATKKRLSTKQVHSTAIKLGAIAIIISLIAILLTPSVVDLLYGFGKMSSTSRNELAGLLPYYFIGSGPFVAGLVYVRAHSALGRPKIMTVVAAITVLANVGFNALFIKLFGLSGIGLATSSSYALGTIFLALPWLRRSLETDTELPGR